MGCLSSFEEDYTGRRTGNNPDFSHSSRINSEMSASEHDAVNYERSVYSPQTKEALINSIEENAFSPEGLTAADTALLGRTTKNFLEDRARLGRAEAIERRDEAMRATSATSSSAAGFFSNLTSAISTRFLHGMGNFFNYVSHYFGVEGRSALDNPVWRAITSITPKTEAQRGVFKGWLDDWHKSVTPLAERSGIDPRELYIELGNLAVYEHMPERNQQLLRQWRSDYAEAEAKQARGEKLTSDEEFIFETYPEQIDALERSLQDTFAQFNEDGDRVVKSGGYLDGEAQRLWDETIARLGISDEEARAATAGLRDVYIKMRDRAADAGILNPESIANWPEYATYVPVKTKSDATSGPTGDAHIFDPGRFHHTEGMNSLPMDAYSSIGAYGERIANAIGHQDFGDAMQALWVRQYELKQANPEFDAGIRSYNYDNLVATLRSRDPAARAKAERIYKSADGGGVVVEVPYRDADGNVRTERRLITFDPNWSDTTLGTGVTGASLNQAFTTASKFGALPTNVVARKLAQATSLLGQTVTRFNPLFAPANMNRDAFERMSHLAGRDYTLADGTVINGSRLVGSFAANMGSSMHILFQALRRELPETGPARQLFDEYMRNGLHYQPSQGLLQKKTEITAGNPAMRGFMERLNEATLVGDVAGGVAKAKDLVLSKLDGWNDYFNNVASFAHYKTLREHGMTEAKASAAVLEMMNLYQTGTATGALQVLYPFIRPTMQAAGAMARTFGFAPNARGQFQMNYKGWIGFGSMAAGYAMLMPVFKAMLGTDENGNSRYDMLSVDDLLRFTPLGLDTQGRYLKLPNGFGPMQTAIALTVGMDRWARGLMSGEDAIFNTLKTMFKNITPNDWPSYSASQDPMAWIVQSLSPMTLRPAIDVAVNKNYAGRTITYPVNDPSVAKALSGRKGTPDVWHEVAKNMLQYSKIDMAPEQWRTLFEGYAKGPIRLITELMNENNLRAAGLDKTARQELGPALTALGATMFYGKQVNTEQMLFYDKLDRFNERVRMVGAKLTSDEYGNDKAKRYAYQYRELERVGFTPEEIKEGLALREASLDLKKASQKFGKKMRSKSDWLDGNDDAIFSEFEGYNNEKRDIIVAMLQEIGAI